MDNIKLKPCPFCGNEKIILDSYDPFDGYQGNLSVYNLVCTSCCAVITRKTAEKVVEAWNRRVDNGCECNSGCS